MKVYLVSRKDETKVAISTVIHQEANGTAEILGVSPSVGDLHSSNGL